MKRGKQCRNPTARVSCGRQYLKCADFIPAARVTFNVAYLSRIAAAAENDVITIEMKDAMDTLAPLRVICHTDEHVDAVLMPCRGK